MQIRTFIALELPPALRYKLQEIVLRYSKLCPPGVNWVSVDNLHMTMLFIGDVQQEKIPELNEVLIRLLHGFPPFKFVAEGLELFPAPEPRMLWLKLSCENDDIFKLHKRLLREISSLGISPDRKPLRLHVTLARLKTTLSPDLERELMQIDFEPQSMLFERICMFRSVLSPSGPTYTILEDYNLE
jgi:2'-5' RNA ligase